MPEAPKHMYVEAPLGAVAHVNVIVIVTAGNGNSKGNENSAW